MAEHEMGAKWLGSREGVSHRVLPPWTPVKVDLDGDGHIHVAVWGRTYIYGCTPAPVQIISAGAELLASPGRMDIEFLEEPIIWEPMPAEVVIATPERAVLRHELRSSGMRISSRTEISYDGLAMVDWEISARDEVTITRLSIDLPVRREHARYLYHYPGRWGDVTNARALPPEGYVDHFRPFVWVGDEQRGLSSLSETKPPWALPEGGRSIEIFHDADAAVQRSQMIGKPITLGRYARACLRGSVAYQATPVKPPDRDAWDYRTVHVGNYGMETPPGDMPATLTYQAERNIDFRHGTIQFWALSVPQEWAPSADQTLLRVIAGNGNEISISWGDDGRRIRLSAGEHTVEGQLPCPAASEWSHYALVWPEPLCLYVNATPVVEVPGEYLVDGEPIGGSIIFGSDGGHLVVDEIAVSSAAHSPEQLQQSAAGQAPPDTDAYGMLVDHLDHPLALGAIEYLDAQHGGVPGTSPSLGRGRGIVGRRGTCSHAAFVPGRSGTALQLGLKKSPLEALAYYGVRTVCFHSHWTDIHSYTKTTYSEQLHSLVTACHQHGMQILLYFGCLVSSLAPEFERWAPTWLALPQRGYSRHSVPPMPLQDVYVACPAGPWQDFVVQGIADTMDEFDIDGVYLDGIANPPECYNFEHGCGHIGENGLARPTYPFLETRRMLRRIYSVVKQRKPDGQVNVHQSGCMAIPSLGWATSYWDGEQFAAIQPGPFLLDMLSPDAFRAEFMGHQWGVPAEMLCYDRPFTFSEACALTLLHDVPVRANGLGPSLRQNSQLWQLMDRFGRKQAQWLPYWANSEYVTTTPTEALCSIYRHPCNGVLLVVSNLGRTATEVRLRLNLQSLELGDETTICDALSGKDFGHDEGKIAIPLQPLEWRILRARPTG